MAQHRNGQITAKTGAVELGITEEVEELWKRLFGTEEPSLYGFAASEAFRRSGFSADRAAVRRWAPRNGIAHSKQKKPHASFCRRQCQDVGALWQLDASTHRWFGRSAKMFPMIEIVDDCSRVITGARLYVREDLMAYLDLTSKVCEQYGHPLGRVINYVFRNIENYRPRTRERQAKSSG
jgi:hypothetical protein